jgi:hypothetical protein
MRNASLNVAGFDWPLTRVNGIEPFSQSFGKSHETVPPHYRGLFAISGVNSGLLAQRKIRRTTGPNQTSLHQRPLVETCQHSLPLFDDPMAKTRADLNF